VADRAVFLDRDGTIIEEVGYAVRTEQIRILAGVARALSRLSAAGYKLVVVTNQSGIARGLMTEEDLDRFHQALDEQLDMLGARLDAYYTCPHLPDQAEAKRPDLAVECDCRKPRPGLILRAAEDLDLDLAGSWIIGDMWRDIAAGHAAGVRTIKLPADAAHDSPRPADVAPPTAEAGDIEQAAEIVLSNSERVQPSAPMPAPPPEQETAPAPVESAVAAPAEVDSAAPPDGQVEPTPHAEEAEQHEPQPAAHQHPKTPAKSPQTAAQSPPLLTAQLPAQPAAQLTPHTAQPLSCARCGVEVAAAEVQSGKAGYRGEFLLCPTCLPQQARDATDGLPGNTIDLLRGVLVELRRLGRLRHGGGLSMLRLLAYLVQAAALFCGVVLALMHTGPDRATALQVAALLQLLVITILLFERNS